MSDSGGLRPEPVSADDFLTGFARSPTSRRTFIKGVIASGAAVPAAGFIMRSSGVASAFAQTSGAVERLVTLNVNGKDRRVDVLPQETLSHTLRYKLGLTGTKLGCDHGECGACTVLVDDLAIYSCSTLTHAVRSRKITTVEGLQGPNGELHKVQAAFVEELGPQCGFCTVGQVMSAVALLKANPKPTVDEARLAMSGNLCRCGAYDHYLRGVMRAAQEA
jgi:aerobic-type carbon monoxide dehydrogenase small subunit (CoxS/CutS family)